MAPSGNTVASEGVAARKVEAGVGNANGGNRGNGGGNGNATNGGKQNDRSVTADNGATQQWKKRRGGKK